jgi:hypothetical protein
MMMQKSCREMALRAISAEARFVEAVMADGLTETEARLVADSYCHLGLLRFDHVDGQYYIKHGGLYDMQIMRNAIENHAQIKATRPRKYGKR